jgi:ketosteroid isomerase-like protein
MLTEEHARKIAEDWIDAWNRHDLDAIMAHYTDDIEFWSPLVISRLGIASGKLEGKTQLRAYFARGLETIPNLHFELRQVLVGADSITIYYQRESGKLVAEMSVLNEAGKAIMARVHYTAS